MLNTMSCAGSISAALRRPSISTALRRLSISAALRRPSIVARAKLAGGGPPSAPGSGRPSPRCAKLAGGGTGGVYGVFIDAENVGARYGDMALTIARMRAGRVACAFAYGDWGRGLPRWEGVELVQVSRAAGKNSSDLRMCIDVVRKLYTSDIERYMLVTGDADFRHLLQAIKQSGRLASVYNCHPRPSPLLVDHADEYLDLS